MRALIQRVRSCSVRINGKVHSSIGPGMLVLLGVRIDDTERDAGNLAERCKSVRLFDDGLGKMNLSVQDTNGSVMVVSQFTLYGDARKGNRPSYSNAASAGLAEELYKKFIQSLRSSLGTEKVASGVFRAMMEVELINDGPVTIMIESRR